MHRSDLLHPAGYVRTPMPSPKHDARAHEAVLEELTAPAPLGVSHGLADELVWRTKATNVGRLRVTQPWRPMRRVLLRRTSHAGAPSSGRCRAAPLGKHSSRCHRQRRLDARIAYCGEARRLGRRGRSNLSWRWWRLYEALRAERVHDMSLTRNGCLELCNVLPLSFLFRCMLSKAHMYGIEALLHTINLNWKPLRCRSEGVVSAPQARCFLTACCCMLRCCGPSGSASGSGWQSSRTLQRCCREGRVWR